VRQAFRKYLECGIFAHGRIFLKVIGQSLQSNSSGAAQVDKAALHIGAIAFTPARGPPLWDDCDAQTAEGVAVELVETPVRYDLTSSTGSALLSQRGE